MIEVQTYDNEKRYIFSNWTSEDFTGVWASVPTVVKAGESIEVPQYKAYHFTKHLVDREMIKDNKENSMASPEARAVYEEKTVAEITGNVDSPALAAIKEKIKEEIEVESGKKKATKKKKEVVEEESGEFADIK